MVALKYAVRVNGMTSIALTKLDVLSGLDEISVCVAYDVEGGRLEHFTGNAGVLACATPVFERFEGWKEDIASCRSFDDLPSAAQNYVRYIEKETGVPVQLIGVGPGRDETIVRGL